MKAEYDFLDKDIVKVKLVNASLYLMAFHLLKSSIVEGVKDFFTNGFDKEGFTVSDNYQRRVLSRSKYKFDASLLFLVEVDAITQFDLEEIQSLREYRNQLAHDIPSCIFESELAVDYSKITRAGHFLSKVDNFWGKTDIDSNPNFDSKDVNADEIVSLRAMVFHHIAQIVKDNH